MLVDKQIISRKLWIDTVCATTTPGKTGARRVVARRQPAQGRIAVFKNFLHRAIKSAMSALLVCNVPAHREPPPLIRLIHLCACLWIKALLLNPHLSTNLLAPQATAGLPAGQQSKNFASSQEPRFPLPSDPCWCSIESPQTLFRRGALKIYLDFTKIKRTFAALNNTKPISIIF